MLSRLVAVAGRSQTVEVSEEAGLARLYVRTSNLSLNSATEELRDRMVANSAT